MRRFALLLVGLLTLTAVTLHAGDLIRVTPLVRDGHLLVSFELAGSLPEAMRETIRSGLTTTFAYDLELRRAVPAWIDRTLATTAVSASVQFDNLTRRYQLSRSIDGRVEAAVVTENGDEVARWLTRFERLPLFRTTGLEPNAEYYVRVRARARPRNTWSIWPWEPSGSWGHARFTFIP